MRIDLHLVLVSVLLGSFSTLACSGGSDSAGEPNVDGLGGDTSSASGGAASGGSSADGGLGGRGATDASGGSGTGGSGAVSGSFDFGDSLEGFDVLYEKLAEGEVTEAPFDSYVVHTDMEGDPDVGAIELTVPFTDVTQVVRVGLHSDASLNLENKSILARVKLESGLSGNEMCPGSAYLYARSTSDGFVGRGVTKPLVEGEWKSLTLNLAAPDDYANGFDDTDIVEYGVAIATSPSCFTSPDWQTAVVHIDTLSF